MVTLKNTGLFWRQHKTQNTTHTDTTTTQMSRATLPIIYNYFPVDSFGGSSDLAGTGSTLFSGRLFRRELKFGRNWLHIIFQQIVLEAAQIWQELAAHYFLMDCFGGSSDMAETRTKKLTTVLYTKYIRNTKNYFPTEPKKLT